MIFITLESFLLLGGGGGGGKQRKDYASDSKGALVEEQYLMCEEFCC